MRQWLVAGLLVSMSVVAGAAQIVGVKLDERTMLGTSELILNGAGLCKRFFFKMYVAGRYVTEKRNAPTGVFALAGPKRASITLLRDLPVQELADPLTTNIRANSSPASRKRCSAR